jgi:phosphoribosyl 1,2-cyclic phosphodiesterase
MAALTITYWGLTGGITAPLTPAQVTDKIVRAVAELVDRDRLRQLRPGAGLVEVIRREVERLPFTMRSSYGGNTTCVEVRTADDLLILDCGSGIRQLSVALDQRWNAPGYVGSREAHLIMTHPHLDHVLAGRFLEALFDARNSFTLWAPRIVLDNLQTAFDPSSPLNRVFHPITLSTMLALRDVREVRPESTFHIGATQVRTFALRHPGDCLGYRLDNGGHSFVFATDHEQVDTPDHALADFARNADLLYSDGQYLQDEYEGRTTVPGETHPLSRRGWGHSSVEACVATAVAAGVRELHVGHREPKRSDDDLARFDDSLRRLVVDELRRAGRAADSLRASVPYEGLTVTL